MYKQEMMKIKALTFTERRKALTFTERICKLQLWNCRGLGKPRAVCELNDVVRTFNPKIIGLLGTKIDKLRLDFIRCTLGFKHGFVVDRVGIFWRSDIMVEGGC